MKEPTATCSMIISALREDVFDAFVQPEKLVQFWLASADKPLGRGVEAHWEFKVPGATETTTVELFEPPRKLSFRWSDGVDVTIAISDFDGSRVLVEVTVSGFGDGGCNAVANTVEGFAIVLCDLKLFLEQGVSPGLVAAKAELISRP